MFTGIIEDLGKITRITDRSLVVSTKLDDISVGESVSISGVCLTAVRIKGAEISFDVTPETIKRTGFSRLSKGSLVNLERAMKLGSRFGGHIVSGHIDDIGKILKIQSKDESFEFTFSVPASLMKYIVFKGSVAIDGISLTVAQLQANNNSFMAAVIPHTYQNTSLKLKKIGALVNIETDVFSKHIENIIKNGQDSNKLTTSFLKENGFV